MIWRKLKKSVPFGLDPIYSLCAQNLSVNCRKDRVKSVSGFYMSYKEFTVCLSLFYQPLSYLTGICPLENSVDPDQLASEEAS